jgi:hypothetical protein
LGSYSNLPVEMPDNRADGLCFEKVEVETDKSSSVIHDGFSEMIEMLWKVSETSAP